MAAGKPCPQCGDTVSDLLKIDPGLRQRLRETGEVGDPPEECCANCYKTLTAAISQGAQLRAKQLARDQQRMIMWRNRVNLLRQAKSKMADKSLSEAAIFYEKYLRVLEIIYEVQPGELKPEFFKNKAREQELTAITSVYWDLIKIYDSSPRYGERQQKTSAKLIEFARAAGISNKITKNANSYKKQAKNPAIFENIAKAGGIGSKGCFIATSAFENPYSPEVTALAHWRDHYLLWTKPGRAFVRTYYFLSPHIARWLDRNSYAKPLARRVLAATVFFLRRRFSLPK